MPRNNQHELKLHLSEKLSASVKAAVNVAIELQKESGAKVTKTKHANITFM
jgi:hypothetical protein